MENNFKNLDSMLEEAKEQAQETKYKRPKKGETTKLSDYKKITKPENPKEERQIAKNEILILANDLYREKKINKPLFNKLWNMTVGAARLPTLQATLLSLQDFKKEENKSYKKADFKAKVKEAKTENLGTFNVYVKYRVTSQRNNNDEEDIEIIDINITDKVIGKSNIPNTIKKNLQYLLEEPYNI